MAAIEFDGVWKKFRRGEQHDSLRDLIPSMIKGVLGRSHKDDLDKDDFWVLRNVSFKVEQGQALGIIGRNGAGKSTTLKLLSKIIRPTRGKTAVRGRVGALIEIAAGFHPDLTGRENVFLQGAILGMKRSEIAQNFDAIVSFAELGDFIDTPVKRYSSGMNARLGFSVAAHLKPEVLLIDEVLAVGDIKFQQKCMDRLRDFRREGLAIAFVSHNMQAIAALCDRAILLRPNDEPIYGTVDEVVMAYSSGAAAREDSRLRISSAVLCHADGTPVTGPIKAGGALSLRIRGSFQTDRQRCAIQLYVNRSDGLSIFDGVSFTDGVEAVDVIADSEFELEVAFVPQLLRGLYTVGINIVDPDRRLTPIQMPSIASFIVHESTRWGGCAELRPRYSFNVGSAATVLRA